MHQWLASNFKNKTKQLKEIGDSLDRLFKSKSTKRVSLDEYPNVKKYISDRFPGLNLNVKIYRASATAVNRARLGLRSAGGAFFPHFNAIILKNKSSRKLKSKGKFDELLSKYNADIEIEDVLVHEVLHAVSTKLGRSSRFFSHMEEEFVYTNCVDFYKAKGMTEKDIVENNFLPFCIQDVFRSSKDLKSVFAALFETGVDTSVVYDGLYREIKKFENDNAEFLVSKIVDRAKERGYNMLKLYKPDNLPLKVECKDESLLRFSSIDFD